ncbi:hypothetical protein GJV85_03600 [Sulfurimonas aquatica]|uniref:Phytanoyl-CoA dioxygenase n=1 Tax=Sulfurimonas aquatica TaxID=2672570 RepID=A0A975AZA8_9BACT|nr:hypothetical protein [Sulfurimonas aquatica]QSZ41235.1 hypothetical protein GJV85_03600 [Sulfurimonas aquatica]
MHKKFKFKIDDKQFSFNAEGSPPLKYGIQERLSNERTDLTFGQEWYEKGFKIFPFLGKTEFNSLYSGISNCVRSILSEKGIEVTNFQLNKYHRFLPDNNSHYEVVNKTRDLFSSDFDFNTAVFYKKLSELVGFELTDINPNNEKKMHIIIRINRPRSNDFNPPHKDIHESFDRDKNVYKFINFWIPICGVSLKSSLPLVSGSHLLPEDKILRTFEGGVIQKKKYNVRNIVSWDGRNDLRREDIRYGNVLIFSSHLIHGCAINDQDEETRVALEFRLFKK